MKSERNKELAKIHIAAKQLGMDEDTYRAMLGAVAGVNSAADLTASGRKKVLAHLRACGFKTKGRRHAGKPDYRKLYGEGKVDLLKKIEAHLAEARRPWNYVHAMARHMFKVDRVQWCTPDQLHKIVAALQYDARRHGRFTGNAV